jgi:glyoxylase-like metal-dependent hydrolase (beta-lactamase superfamily II)
MIMNLKKTLLFSFMGVLLIGAAVSAVRNADDIDLTGAATGRGWKVVNRAVTVIEEDGRKGIRLDERPGDGLVWLEGVRFSSGEIEFDVRGQDAFQKSFVGAAFHGVDDATFEAVYFRPFNFKPADPARAARAVQYVSHPEFTWQKLRAEKPGRYEKPVDPVPDPNGWFHVRIVVAPPAIRVFVNGSQAACLTVDVLSDRREGLVGLMVGNGSGGDFAGFKIIPAAVASPGAQGLLEAVKAGDLAWVKTAVERDPGIVNAKGPGGQAIIFAAISFNRGEIARYLVAQGADVNATSNFHLTPLTLACARKAPLAVVRLLVEAGADVNAAAKYSGNPLDNALEAGDPAVVDYLKSKGALPTPLDFETFRLADRVHRIAYPWGMRNHIVVFSGPDGILLVDTGFSKRAVGELGKTIASLARGDIRFIINTHSHGDHVDGNAIAPAGAKVLNFTNLESPEFKGLIAKGDRPFRGRGTQEIGAPFVMRLNGEDVHIIPNPGLHSEGDLLIYFPKSNVLCMGDLLLSQNCPALQDVAGYMAFLDKVIDIFPAETTFVSGHGKDLTMDGLKKYRDDLAGMISIVRENFAAGKTTDVMLQDDVLGAYKAEYSFLDWIGPDSWLRRIAEALGSGRSK